MKKLNRPIYNYSFYNNLVQLEKFCYDKLRRPKMNNYRPFRDTNEPSPKIIWVQKVKT